MTDIYAVYLVGADQWTGKLEIELDEDARRGLLFEREWSI
jgi:hypothetical protein